MGILYCYKQYLLFPLVSADELEFCIERRDADRVFVVIKYLFENSLIQALEASTSELEIAILCF
jgi:hypothetical protein